MKRLMCFLTAFVMLFSFARPGYARLRPDDILRQTAEPMREFFASRETVSGYINVPGRGEMYYYAQNDPRWAEMRYNLYNKLRRGHTLAGAGCAPTAFAMLLRAVVPFERLSDLFEVSYKGGGYTFCICSSQPTLCSGAHTQFTAETAEDLADYLPIVIASYQGGNNQSRRSGNVILKPLLTSLDIPFTYTTDRSIALEALKDGAVIFSNTGTAASPFTSSGHYVVLASYDDGFIYVLDPYYRDSYDKSDKKHVLELIQPGLVRAHEADFKRLYCSGFVIVYPQGERGMVQR